MVVHKLKDKTILIISPESWEHIFVSKHHYAITLAEKGNRVYFLNPPSAISGKIEIREASGHPNLYVIDYRIFFKGLRFLPSSLRRTLERNFINRLEKKAGRQFDVIWNFENSRFYDLNFAGENVLKIYHQVDHNQDFHPETAARTADIVFAVNTPIYEELKEFNKNCYRMPHAYQGHLSEQASEILRGRYTYYKPKRLQTNYVGNLDFYYIDKALLEKLVASSPDVDFNFYGPYDPAGETYQRLSKYPYVSFKGRIPSSEVPEVLSRADILFFIYDTSLIASSHKLLEYLGSGKPIVSTYLQEYSLHYDLLEMADTKENYVSLFRHAIENIERLCSLTLMQKRIEFAMEHSYKKQLDRIEELIEISAAKK